MDFPGPPVDRWRLMWPSRSSEVRALNKDRREYCVSAHKVLSDGQHSPVSGFAYVASVRNMYPSLGEPVRTLRARAK